MVNSNDFSVFALFTAGLATLTNAYATAIGPFPSGNAFSFPGAGQSVQVGVPFDVTWAPTTPEAGPVTIYLCKGPSTNCVNEATPIAISVPNSGHFSWVPSADLIPTNGQGYGLQLVVDSTGAYQWTPQFGISNPSAGPTIRLSTQLPTVTVVPSASPAPVAPTSASVIAPAPVVPTVITSAWKPTGTGAAPTTIIQPTGTLSVPSSLIKTTTKAPAPTNTPPPFTGAASKTTVGFGAVFGILLAAFAL